MNLLNSLDSLENSRAYVWVADAVLSRAQLTVQTGHALAELSVKDYGHQLYRAWANTGKTLIVFSGGTSGNIQRIHTILRYINQGTHSAYGLDLPVSIFHEDMETLGGAATATAFVLPNSLRSPSPGSLSSKLGANTLISTNEYHNYAVEQKDLVDALHMMKMFGSQTAVRNPDAFDVNIMAAWMNSQKLLPSV